MLGLPKKNNAQWTVLSMQIDRDYLKSEGCLVDFIKYFYFKKCMYLR